MATSVAQRKAADTRGGAVRGGGPALAASLTAPDVPDWTVQRPQLTKLIARSARQPRPGVVSRAGLVEAARSSDCRFVAVTAPAGYGKSMFLAEWAAAEDRRVVWVSLDRFDDDPAMLLASLASAYCRAGLGSAELVADKGGPVWVLGRAVPRLAAELRASPVPFVLLLDDLHELQSPACHDVLDTVISAIPRGSQLAAASRCEQPHLPRLRASGEALELGAGDLALDAAGAQQIFASAQVSLTPGQAAAITERAEGWPAGLYLAALITRKRSDQAPAVTGDDPYVADYLYRETLMGLPEDMQLFLRRTAVLDQLSGPLCDAALASSGAAGYLRRLEAVSLFLVPLDHRRQWYRYHALFREFLLGELGRAEPGIVMTLHQRAAAWHEASGSPAQALEHLLHTTDWDRSVRLTAALAPPAVHAGQLPTLQRWLRTIGDAKIERYPPLAVMAGWAGALSGDTARAERWAASVDAASSDGVPSDGSSSFESARATLRAVMCAGGPEQMMADATFAVAHEPPWGPWRSDALWLLGEANLLAGRLDEARAALAEGSTTAATLNTPDVITLCEAQLALLAMDHGEWQEAADRLERALAVIDEHQMHDCVFSIPAFAGAARLSLHHSDLNETHRQLTRAMRARPTATYLLPYHAVRLRLQLAKVYLGLADVTTARQLLREIDDILRQRPVLGALIDEVNEFRRVLVASATTGMAEMPPLTPAELRLLPYLQTHLTAERIAERLFVSSHTVKTQVKSIYRKLGVSSRNEAVQHATAIGLLGA
jgi:LuxR family transcriptional regulator, maltose regulon positive regulatory protein